MLIGVVRVAGTEPILDLFVVARTRVRVLDENADRGPGGLPLEHTRQDAHLVAFLALAHELRGAGATAVHVTLQIGFADFEPWRTTIDDAAQRGAVALAKRGHGEQTTDGITRHQNGAFSNCSRVSRNTPPPPRSKSSQVNGNFGNAFARIRSVLPTSTTSRPRGRKNRRASRRMVATESRPSRPEARASRGSWPYSRGRPRISRSPT